MKRILIVEDEPEIGEFLLAYLQQEGYEAVWAGDAWRQWMPSTRPPST